MSALISGIAGIVFLITFIFYVKHNQKKWNISAEAFIDLQKRVSELELQQYKDREKIADSLNELIKNSNENKSSQEDKNQRSEIQY